MPTHLGVWSLGLFSPTFFSTSSNKKKRKKKKDADREASLIKSRHRDSGPPEGQGKDTR